MILHDPATGEAFPPSLLRRAARDLEREARALAKSYRVPGSTAWDCPNAQRDHDRYRATARSLRRMARALSDKV